MVPDVDISGSYLESYTCIPNERDVKTAPLFYVLGNVIAIDRSVFSVMGLLPARFSKLASTNLK